LIDRKVIEVFDILDNQMKDRNSVKQAKQKDLNKILTDIREISLTLSRQMEGTNQRIKEM